MHDLLLGFCPFGFISSSRMNYWNYWRHLGLLATLLSLAMTLTSAELAPLYRFKNNRGGHSYTLEFQRNDADVPEVLGSVFPTPTTGTVPLYQYVNSKNSDQLLTTNWGEFEGGKREVLYAGILCYAYGSPHTGTVPLHRFSYQIQQHFYTSNWTVGGVEGYRYEGITAYIFPAQKPLPLPCTPELPAEIPLR